MKLKKSEEKFLKHARVIRVATVGPGSMPHAVPVCPLLERGVIYFGTDKNTRKIKNLKGNPRIALVLDEYSEDWSYIRGVLVQGRAEVIESAAEFRRIRNLLYEKFQQYKKEAQLDQKDSVIVRVTPEKTVSWGLK